MVNILFDRAKLAVMERTQVAEKEAEALLLSASEYICSYCNVDEVPDGLYHALVLLAVDRQGQDSGGGKVQRIRRGDTDISYQSEQRFGGGVREEIRCRLRRFRKVLFP